MEQQIGYAKSRDGTRIGYSVSGAGAPVLNVPAPLLSNVLFNPGTDPIHCVSGIATAGRARVNVDLRGCGIADRDVHDYALDRMVEDILAVADELGFAWFDLFTGEPRSPIAIRLAATHPERVRRMALLGPQMPKRERLPAFRSLLEADFDTYLGTIARLLLGYSDDEVPGVVAYMRSCVNQADLLRQVDAMEQYDVCDDFARVRCPVLVTTISTKLLDMTRGAAEVLAQIPGARLQVFEPVDGELAFARPAAAAATFFAEGLEGGEATPVLSPRELDVLRRVADGCSNKAIAEDLVLSVRTVDRHVSDIYTKLDLHNRAEATAWAIRHRVV